MRHLLFVFAAVTVFGCGGGGKATEPRDAAGDSADREVAAGDLKTVDLVEQADAEEEDLSTELVPWERPAPLRPWPGWVEEQQGLTSSLSSWSYGLEEQNPADLPPFRELADFGLGNGKVFSLIGYSYPFNTLHSMVGPGYEKGEGFFSDVKVELATGPGGSILARKHEQIAVVRDAPVVLTRAESTMASLTTVDLTPLGHPGQALERALIRAVVVKNESSSVPVKGAVLRISFSRPQELLGDALLEMRNNRFRAAFLMSGAPKPAAGDSLEVPLDELAPGGEQVFFLVFLMGADKAALTADQEEVRGASFEALLEESIALAGKYRERATRVHTPDPLVDDLLVALVQTMTAQTAETGAVCPMSQYTGTWLRDLAGPVRFLLSMGLFEEARAAMDYVWLATLENRDIRNSFAADLSLDSSTLTQPDWDSLGPMTGRIRAESPSYIPLLYGWIWRASGWTDFISERLGMMKRALLAQGFEDDLLPFSTDETFRTAMAIAHSLPVDESFEQDFLSANSSFLWVAAAQLLIAMLEGQGEEELQAVLRTRAEEVREAADSTFSDQAGMYLPYIKNGDLAAAAFEDVSTKPLWTGFLGWDQQQAWTNLAGAIAAIGGDDGLLISPLPALYENWMGLPISQGIYTGMSPGYYLWNLAAVHHPLAEKAFNKVREHATPLGTFPEYQMLDGYLPLQLMYDPSGEIGDYTARFRPWEGGIVGEAVMKYLVGAEPDASSRSLVLAPHLPNGWPWLEVSGIRLGDARVGMNVKALRYGRQVQLTLEQGAEVGVELRLETPAGTVVEVSRDGQPLTDYRTLPLPWGNQVVIVSGIQLEGEDCLVVVKWSE